MTKVMIAIIVLSAVILPAQAAFAVITMTLDRDLVDFRTMESGQTVVISDQGVYHNEITCTSTNNQPWYLKANMIRPFTSGMNTIPNEDFQWMVVDVINGKGIVYNNKNVPNPFTNFKSLIYTSDPEDNTGVEVKIRFRYILKLSKRQIAGNYFGSVRWTMTELL
ncbi:MAG: hypothetical protein Q8N91_02240 [Candidatus Omnitrophota bacterium]|nr:hypothetical protein [Candidatus Omnitrophota bacterium]